MLAIEAAMLRASRHGERNAIYADVRRRLATKPGRVDLGATEAARQAAIQNGPDSLWLRRSERA